MAEHFDPFLTLADEIRELFTPYAMRCSCKGEDRSCARALEDPAVWAQFDTMERIARHIESHKLDHTKEAANDSNQA